MTEDQEQARLAELRDMAEQDVGAVSLLSHEMAVTSKINSPSGCGTRFLPCARSR